MVIREGSRVAYVGDGDHDLSPGDEGIVVSASGDEHHVSWRSGAQEGKITLHGELDLITITGEPTLGRPSEALPSRMRAEFDRRGPEGVVSSLYGDGSLTQFAPLVDEALGMVVAALRSDEGMLRSLSYLEADESEEVLLMAASSLIEGIIKNEDM